MNDINPIVMGQFGRLAAASLGSGVYLWRIGNIVVFHMNNFMRADAINALVIPYGFRPGLNMNFMAITMDSTQGASDAATTILVISALGSVSADSRLTKTYTCCSVVYVTEDDFPT